MNLRSFNWKLGYGSKGKSVSTDDQNSLLFDEPESPSHAAPQSSAKQPQTTVLFSNDNAFDDFLISPKSLTQQNIFTGNLAGKLSPINLAVAEIVMNYRRLDITDVNLCII